jgi:hypothetical protein
MVWCIGTIFKRLLINVGDTKGGLIFESERAKAKIRSFLAQ